MGTVWVPVASLGKTVLGGAKAFQVFAKVLPVAFSHLFSHRYGGDDRAVLKRLSTDERCCVPAHISAAGSEA